MLLVGFAYTANLVDAAFHGAQSRGKKRALTGEDVGHEAAKRLQEQDDQNAVKRDLQPSVDRHVKQPSSSMTGSGGQGIEPIQNCSGRISAKTR